MADINQMMDLNNLGSQSQLANTGGAIGGTIGMAFGNPIAGTAIGSAVGTIASKLMPEYSHVKGSVSSINFIKMNRRPYMITLIKPDSNTAKQLSDYYCYYGNKTNRQEALNISSYMYQGHAYVRGNLHYNGSIPLDKFMQIQKIFNAGTHILNS